MMILKQPLVNIFFIGFMSAVYAFIFIFTAGHIEFIELLSHSKTLESAFWNGWSDFIRSGNMKYIGYLIMGLAISIVLIIVLKRTKEYDGYQVSILVKSLMMAGVLSILMIPFLMIMLLSDPNYSVETIFLFATLQWFIVLFSYMVSVFRV
jgi:hypothetical protein